jgi:hypothetical protein
LGAAGALTRPYIANAAATTAEVWWAQGFAQEEDAAFKKVVADYEKASGNTIDYSLIPYAPERQKIISAVTSGVVPDLFQNNPFENVARIGAHQKVVAIRLPKRQRQDPSWSNPSFGSTRLISSLQQSHWSVTLRSLSISSSMYFRSLGSSRRVVRMMNGKSDQGGWLLTQSKRGTGSVARKASSAITAVPAPFSSCLCSSSIVGQASQVRRACSKRVQAALLSRPVGASTSIRSLLS